MISAANDCHDAFSWRRACQCLNPYDGQGRLCHNLSCKLCPGVPTNWSRWSRLLTDIATKTIDAITIQNQATSLAENSQTLKVILSCESRWNASDAAKQLWKLLFNWYDSFKILWKRSHKQTAWNYMELAASILQFFQHKNINQFETHRSEWYRKTMVLLCSHLAVEYCLCVGLQWNHTMW